jgi:hypothetical protein
VEELEIVSPDRMAGSGMTELLQIIDVQRDGRDEIFYGGTTATARYFDAAVFRRGNLRRVLRPKGKPLALVEEIKPSTRDGAERRIGKAFGCRDRRRQDQRGCSVKCLAEDKEQ